MDLILTMIERGKLDPRLAGPGLQETINLEAVIGTNEDEMRILHKLLEIRIGSGREMIARGVIDEKKVRKLILKTAKAGRDYWNIDLTGSLTPEEVRDLNQ